MLQQEKPFTATTTKDFTVDTTEVELKWLVDTLKEHFKMDYIENLIKRIIRNNDRYRIGTLADLVRKYPEFGDTLEIHARRKFENPDRVKLEKEYSHNSSKTFWRIESGATLIVPLLEFLITGDYIVSTRDKLLKEIKLIFENSVYTKDSVFLGIEVYNYINSNNTLECIPVKFPKDEKSNNIEIFYMSLNINAEKVDSFLHTESKTSIKALVKSQFFTNAQGLYDWVFDTAF